jgi:primosomal protein N' (replication factor Y)
MNDAFAEVSIIGTALDKSLHYTIPARLSESIQPGNRVVVGLGKRKAGGIVLSITDTPPDLPENVTLRPIFDVIGSEPVIPPDLLALCKWISTYYFYPLGEVLGIALPLKGMESLTAALEELRIKTVCLAGDSSLERKKLTDTGREIVRLLLEAGGSLPLRDLRKACRSPEYSLKKMLREGLIRIEERDGPKDLLDNRVLSCGACYELTDDQKNAVEAVLPYIERSAFRPFTLHGVTGSGKTEVYLRLVARTCEEGKGSLVLVPEIALSTQLEAVFRERFGSRLAVWHSALSTKERLRQWAEILAGTKQIVLGARSAVLTPVRNLGLVIVDEEHETSYKQDDHLRYNARDTALMRGKLLDIPVILGSATPSLQTVYRTGLDQYRSLALPSRVFNRPQPEFEVVDMRREARGKSILSARLQESIGETLQNREQVLLFLNRRGYSKYFLCNTCGHVIQCISCSLALTYHKGQNSLRCHYCGWETPLPERCPECSHAALFAHGFGTERVEKEIERLFPKARQVRVDRDTMNSREKILSALDAVRTGSADILLGTQMIAKGHDFPNITLVGIINADAGLQIPDFRAGETLVQLLLQVAGRAGRGDRPGRVILQTYNPFHFTIESALKMNYEGFCETELESRKLLQYPPFTRLLKFLVTGKSEEATRAGARLLAEICRQHSEELKSSGTHIAVLGPSPAAHVKLKNRFRWHIFIKTWNSREMQHYVEIVLRSVQNEYGLREVEITVDRDPSTEG